ncbi:MAG: PPOX class F420-dependent oxidoreductase [Actinomycetota bacterium]
MAAIPDSHRDILEKKGFASVATVDASGSPQSSAVWFDWDGRALTFSTTKGRAKYKNLARSPRVSILILDIDDPYRYIELRGEVTFADDPTGTLIDKLSRRYYGEPWTRPTDDRVIVSLEPDRVQVYG